MKDMTVYDIIYIYVYVCCLFVDMYYFNVFANIYIQCFLKEGILQNTRLLLGTVKTIYHVILPNYCNLVILKNYFQLLSSN